MEECSREAALRYVVVSQVLSHMALGDTQGAAVSKVAATPQYFPGETTARRVSERSIYRWLESYRRNQMAGLETSARRESAGPGGVLPQKFLQYLVQEKTLDPRTSIPEIIRRAVERGLLERDAPADRTTVYRAAKALGLPVARRKKGPDREVRRFAYPHRMDMILADGVHFRAGARRARRVAFFFLDDSSRYGLEVVVGTSENAALFQRGVFELVAKFGFFSAIYLDRGPGFIAEDTYTVISNLRALLIYGEAAYPEGHGKIERFNQTVGADLLRGLDRRPDVDPEPRSLELRLKHYLETHYNHRPHESLKGETPSQRFLSDSKDLCFPESLEELRSRFEVYLSRRVSADNVVSVDSVAYEMPSGYAGTKVLLRKKLLAGGGIFFLHHGRLLELHPVDLAANARSGRPKRRVAQEDLAHPPPPSAADLAFQRELGSLLDPDGGCPDPQFPFHCQEEP